MTAHPVDNQFPGHGYMDDPTNGRSIDSQTTWVIYMLGLSFWNVIHGCLHNQSLADDRLTGAGIKCLHCRVSATDTTWLRKHQQKIHYNTTTFWIQTTDNFTRITSFKARRHFWHLILIKTTLRHLLSTITVMGLHYDQQLDSEGYSQVMKRPDTRHDFHHQSILAEQQLYC